jgi:fatty-acyl-CoA synthase
MSAHFTHWPRALPRTLEGVSRPPTLHAALHDAAQRTPDKVLSHFFGARLRYGEALRQVDALAGWLQHVAGVRRGDRVLLALQNSPQFLIAWYAILRADAVVVPLSPMHTTTELAHYLEDSGAGVAIYGQELHEAFLGLPIGHRLVAAYADYAGTADLARPAAVAAPRAGLSGTGLALWHTAVSAGHRAAPGMNGAEDLAVLPYTSGSTGQPKGCMHTHATVMHNVLGAVLWESLDADSVALATAPFFHVTGLVHSLNAPVLAGAGIVIQPRWDPLSAARQIEAHRCTHWANVPTMVVDLLSHPEALLHDVSSLRNIFGGGAAMPEAIAQKLFDTCGVRYMEGYGMTETISQTHMNPAQNPRKQCLGIPTFDTESRIVDPVSLAALPPGEPGEIVVRGPQLLTGYWKREDAYRESWIELEGRQWFRTGDLGRMDAEGYFTIADRLKRMINAAGFKVWPAEVEAALYHHPSIKECCVIATPDARKGEAVKLVAVLKPGQPVSAEDIIAWAHARMAAYKVPSQVMLVSEMPKSASGKILWRSLQEREANELKDISSTDAMKIDRKGKTDEKD